jgi:hypothetical protein
LPNPVLEWSLKARYLAIQRHLNALAPAHDSDFLRQQDIQVAFAAYPKKQSTQRQSHQTPSADPVLRYANAELSLVEVIARPKTDSFHVI